MPISTTVALLIGILLAASDLYRLKRVYVPLGKVGGKPAWLNPTRVPKATDIACGVCGKSMAFVIQIYAPLPDCSESTFHRYLYVFVCRNGECSIANEAANLKVIRMQLPRTNNYLSYNQKNNPEFGDNSEDPFYNAETYAHICNTCGLRADSKCAKCSKVWYCSRDHQVVDWNAGHKQRCGKTAVATVDGDVDDDDLSSISTPKTLTKTPAENAFVFKEYGVNVTTDCCSAAKATPVVDAKTGDENSKSESESDEGENETDDKFFARQQRHEQLKEIMDKLKVENADLNVVGAPDPLETLEDRADVAYNRFYSLIQRRPTQLLRYARAAQPLSASDLCMVPTTSDAPAAKRQQPQKSKAKAPPSVPKCKLCGAARIFEFQLMPHLLSLMEVDALTASIDWATVFVYACPDSCEPPADRGFAEEFVYKQDFVAAEAN